MSSETPRVLEPEEIKAIIERGIPGAEVTVTDLTGTRDHYRVAVVAEQFADRPLVQQHRMVYGAIGEHMTQAVHALQILTSTPRDPEENDERSAHRTDS